MSYVISLFIHFNATLICDKKNTEKAGRRVILWRNIWFPVVNYITFYINDTVWYYYFLKSKYYYKRTLISFCPNIIFLEDLLYIIYIEKKKRRWSLVAIRTRFGFNRLLILPDMESVLLRPKSSVFLFLFLFFTFYPFNYRALILK